MPKNIIICCDGTGNQFGEENSNVVKLYSVLKKQSKDQIAFYDPGVGTMSDPGLSIPFGKKLSVPLGLAFGYGLEKNVAEAYTYLMNNYEAEDKVFLFGFSRGAYTVRVLAGLIEMNGLLAKGCENLIPYSWRIFRDRKFNLNKGFKKNYGTPIKIHFMGIWDTVSTIGWISRRRSFPHTANNEGVNTVRHAVAIDERRAYYDQNLWGEKFVHPDIKEVWFAGVHSDVGGSYPEKESGLSKISLHWMLREAQQYGLSVDPERYGRVVLGKGTPKRYVGPDPAGMVHQSLKGVFWWLLELFPKRIMVRNPENNTYYPKRIVPMGRRRVIAEGALIHHSVLEKMNMSNYNPTNLPAQYTIEE